MIPKPTGSTLYPYTGLFCLHDTSASGVSVNAASSASNTLSGTSGTFDLLADNALSSTVAGTIGAHDMLLTYTNNGLALSGAITSTNATLQAHDDITNSSAAS